MANVGIWKWRSLAAAALLLAARVCAATEYHGQVVFNGLPVPGATVTATQGDKKFTVTTDDQGAYSFENLPDGAWKVHVEMQLFAPLDEDVTIAPNVAAGKYELKMLSLAQVMAAATAVKVEEKPAAVALVAPTPAAGAAKKTADAKKADTPQAEAPKAEEPPQQANEGLLINGSVNNAATSQYTLAPAFGNQRAGIGGLYNGGLLVQINNSAFNATPYSISGVNPGKQPYSQVTAGFTFGGPIRIPHLLPRGPNFFVAYQFMRNSDDAVQTGLVPTTAQIATVTDPVAKALLNYYPSANVSGNTGYNYQRAVVDATHQDSLQTRLDKTLGRKDQVYGQFAFQNTRTSGANLFGFNDANRTLGINTSINWNHRFSSRFFVNTGYRFSRARSQETPQFAYNRDIESLAGITGYDKDPSQWGPPSLAFTTSGITGLSDANASFNRSRTDQFTPVVTYFRRKHNFTFGADIRRQESNYYQQSNPRGSFQFTGTATGTDIGDFAQGIADTTSIAYANPDKYLRQTVYALYASDDWRLLPQFTLNVGFRWEYGAPVTELKGRLENYVPSANYSTATKIDATSSQGLPTSLVRPDKAGFEPRVGVSWRPIPGSTLVIRAGYGIYDDTSVYRNTALAMANQFPVQPGATGAILSTANSAACPLTLKNGLTTACASSVADTFAMDPNFRVGYAQTWQISVQRDLPFALQMVATYLGVKGANGLQEFLPNSYAPGATDPYPTSYPSNYRYLTSHGESTRESGSFQLRRRLRSGFTATALYTYSKSIDTDAALGGQGPLSGGATSQSTSSVQIAQNWLDLGAERGPSTFDQRNLLNLTAQYTSGMGLGGGTLMTGWRGKVLKDWTVLGTLVVGSGLPENPIYPVVVPNTTYYGIIRPSLTGQPIYAAPAGKHLNVNAYTAPAAGQWGNAGRNSIVGPGVLTFNSSLQRTFRIEKKLTLDVRMDATNVLNHVTFTSWNTVITSTTFGAPAAANSMRAMTLTARLRWN